MIIENATSNVSVYISILSKGFPTSIHSSSLTFIKILFLLYSHDITNILLSIFFFEIVIFDRLRLTRLDVNKGSVDIARDAK